MGNRGTRKTRALRGWRLALRVASTALTMTSSRISTATLILEKSSWRFLITQRNAFSSSLPKKPQPRRATPSAQALHGNTAKTPPKLIATTRAIKNSNITGSTNFPPDRTRCIFFLRVQNVQLTRELVHNWRTETECPIHRAFEISCMVVPSLSSFHTILKYAYGPIVEDVVSSAGRRRCVATKKVANRQLYTEIFELGASC
ncbi:putative dynein heavy chain [Trypanosoma cruzi]|uniref:Putative dynein heavy chain n=1 Tax=Trypanosoma cruzi TaxID=5693 RepID=A0A2V2WR59_TRYCR|nr:putative dynein heavy chain [Trypanosoma cruzi]